MYKVALNFEDGVTHFIIPMPMETVADAAYRSGINIPVDCRDGACGTCKCHCESGRYEMDGYVEDALSEQEAKQDYVLTCRMIPESDCVVTVPASSEVCVQGRQVDVHAKLSGINRLSDSTLSFTVAGDQLSAMHFLPGQYVNVLVPGSDQSRSYSFSSLVNPVDDSVSFLMRVVSDGLMSTYMTEKASIGDSIVLRGPFGSFYLRDIKRPILMLAGGTGLAPFLAMLEKIQQDGSQYPIHLIYGVTRDNDLVEIEKLEAFAAAIDNFSFSACVASEESDWPRKGYVTNHLNPDHLHGDDVDIYLCGPPPMVEAVSSYMQENGIQPASFHYEKFAASK
ncbi:benzoate 1,2-dioxygenase electron transfer component BenC [Marinobacter excellens]|jgi:benzoate/toluate 1,2-dioxygenase reductase subunit|uniref:Benzoate dioxygenase, ferredoxin reductase component n=1 Tax=Marinobacter excellens LAMA 842 TaxID=1306954 RepID=A0A137S339_9GAMM|nr:benzoate 1,2-dioxygenase electron transfer component BenC [Marinobacter excellens]KXO06847.1 benzoate dioxygenase, ferredoxin reductase component [Marinobacter excellens LAMA 842]